MNEWMNEWVNEWANELMERWMNENSPSNRNSLFGNVPGLLTTPSLWKYGFSERSCTVKAYPVAQWSSQGFSAGKLCGVKTSLDEIPSFDSNLKVLKFDQTRLSCYASGFPLSKRDKHEGSRRLRFFLLASACLHLRGTSSLENDFLPSFSLPLPFPPPPPPNAKAAC